MKPLRAGDELVDILDPYEQADRSSPRGPCWVLANMVGGLDGSASVAGRAGGLSNATDAELFRAIRALSDVVLVGAETVRQERYGPAKLTEQRRCARVAAGKPAVPRVAIVTRSLDLDWDAPIFTGSAPDSATLVVTCEAADPSRLQRARRSAEVVVAGDKAVEPGKALAALAGLGARVVLCEGGPTLLGLLVADDLLDELCFTLAPVMGGDPLPIAVSPPAASRPDPSPPGSAPGASLHRFALAHSLVEDDMLFLRYLRRV